MVMQASAQSNGRLGPGPVATDIDLGLLGRALWRKKVLIAGLTLLAAALAFAAVNAITPRYKSEARVLIETRENAFFRPDAEKMSERSTVDQEAVTSQVQLILSRDLAREIIKKLKLGERAEFDPILDGPSLPRTLLSLVGIIKDPMDMSPEERVLKSYYDRLSAFQVEKSRVIGNDNTTLSSQQLGDFNAQLAAARGQKSDSEAKARMIRDALKTGAPLEFSDIVNSELLRRLSEQRVILRAQLAEQSSTLLDQHPRIKELRAQLADLEGQMRAEADRLARSLENDAKFASAKVDGLSAALDQLKRQAASTNEQDVQLRALEREAKAQRDLLESYLAKYREASARDSIGAAAPDARIISAAAVSNTPSWPKKLPTILVAALAMLVLSSGFVLSNELLGALPAPAAAAEAASAQSRDLAAAVRAIEDARAQAGVAPDAIERLVRDLGGSGAGARRITVIGALRNVGATVTAIALARALAQQARVVLVDLALGAPGLTIIASDPAAPGVSDLVHGSASFGQIITRDRYSRVHLITAGRAPIDAAAVMSSQRLSIAIEALGRSYEHVVIDAGAAEAAAVERLALLAPRAVLVAPKLDDADTAAARERLLTAGFADVSVLVNAPRGAE